MYVSKAFFTVLFLLSIVSISPTLIADDLDDRHSSRVYMNRQGGYSLIASPGWHRLTAPEAYEVCNFKVKGSNFQMNGEQPEIWAWALTDPSHNHILATLACHYFFMAQEPGPNSVLDEIIERYRRSYRDVTICEAMSRVMLNGTIATRVCIRFKNGMSTVSDLKQVIYIVPRMGAYYLITGSALEKDFELHTQDIETMIRTFQLHNPSYP
jgi:hypothetical protein